MSANLRIYFFGAMRGSNMLVPKGDCFIGLYANTRDFRQERRAVRRKYKGQAA